MVGRARRNLARAWRALRAVLLVLAATLVVGALALALAPVRGALLGAVLRAADARLPGRLTVAEAAWPGPGRLRLDGVVWLAETPPPAAAYGDTLLHLRRFELEIDLSRLVARDLRIRRLDLEAVCLDVPALTAVLPAGDAGVDTARPAGGAIAVPWLRSGGADDVPSVAGEAVAVRLERAVVAPDVVVDGVHVDGVLDAGHGASGAALTVRGAGRAAGGGAAPWLVDLADLDLVLRYGPERGAVAVDTCRATVAAAGPRDLEERWRGGEPARLDLAGTARVAADEVAADLRGVVDLPAADLLQDAWPSSLPGADYARLTAGFDVDATAARPGGVRGEAVLELAGSPGWGRSHLAVSGAYDPDRPAAASVRLDTLSAVVPGLAVAGSGRLEDEAYALTIRVRAASPLPLLAVAGPEVAALDLAADLDLALAGRGLPHLSGAEPVRLRLRGGGRAAAPDWLADVPDLALDLVYDPAHDELALDTCRVRVAAAGPRSLEQRWRGGEPARLDVTGTAHLAKDSVAAVLRGVADLPATALLDQAWPAALPRRDYARLTAGFDLDATAARPGGVRGAAVLDLAGSPGWGRSRLVLSGAFDPDRPAAASVRLDTLSAVVPGLTVAGSGRLEEEAYALTVRAAAATPLPLLALAGPDAAAVDLTTDLDLAVTGRGLPHLAGAEPARLRLRGGGRAAAPDWLVDVPDMALDLVYDPARGELGVDTCRVQVAAAGPPSWEERWRRAGPATLELDGTARLDTAAVVLAGRGRLRAPASALAGETWPAGLSREDFAVLEAGVTVDAVRDRAGTVRGRLALTAGGSPGWGRARIALGGAVDPARPADADLSLDTLQIDLAGLRAEAVGSYRAQRYDLEARAELATPSPLLVLAGPELATAEGTVDLDLEVTGTGRDPRGRLALRADGRTRTLEVAGLNLEARRGDGIADLRVAAGRLATRGEVVADSVDLAVRHDAARDLPLDLDLSARRRDAAVDLALAVGADSLVTIRLSDLRLGLVGRQMVLEEPAVLRLDTLRRAVSLDRLALAGDPGRLVVGGELAADTLRLGLEADLLLQEAFLQEVARSPLWSDDGGRDLEVRGSVDLGGTRGAPGLDGKLAAVLRSRGPGRDLGVRLDLGLAGGDTTGLAAGFAVTADDTVVLHGRAVLPGHTDPAVGWVMETGADLLLDVPEQSLPLRFFAPLLPAGTAAAGKVTVAARAAVPPGGPSAERPGEVAGTLRTGRLNLALPNRSRAEVELDCRLEGPALDPRLSGTLTVPSAFIRLPERSRGLHEVEGRSLLWEEAARPDSTRSSAFLAGAGARDWGPEDGFKPPPRLVPDLDLRIHLPGNLRIYGYGLDAELAGNLAVSRGHDVDGVPGAALRGEVGTVQGTVKVMSRVFEIETCTVHFAGRVPADPDLTMKLRAELQNVVVTVDVSGRASDPVVTISSNPAMNEADILAYLIFGRPLNDLDVDQRGRMGQEKDPREQLNDNLAALAFAFGTRGFQNSVTGTLGVDMMELGEDSAGGSTIAAGKFIGPQVLLKYHQSMEKSGTYFMTLEYFVTRVFRIVSTYGQGEEASGIELNWLRRY